MVKRKTEANISDMIPPVGRGKENTFMVELLFLCLALILPIIVIVLSQPTKITTEARAPQIEVGR